MCKGTPKEFNGIDKVLEKPIDRSTFQFGVSPLHFGIRYPRINYIDTFKFFKRIFGMAYAPLRQISQKLLYFNLDRDLAYSTEF